MAVAVYQYMEVSLTTRISLPSTQDLVCCQWYLLYISEHLLLISQLFFLYFGNIEIYVLVLRYIILELYSIHTKVHSPLHCMFAECIKRK